MIHIEGLTKYFGDVCAVDGISLIARQGEILGLLGPNGAGKTTTLRMLTGFLRPTAGSIRVKEHRIEEQPLAIKAMLGYLPESAPLYHDMLVYDYLRYVAAIRGVAPDRRSERIRGLGDLCGINEVMHQTISALSKGYKQRVGLAHAMMADPDVLVLDEPTSGLDPNQIVEIREIIKRIGREKTVIFSTHILSEAEATCDRVAIIHRGKIVADSKTAELKERLGGGSRILITLDQADAAQVSRELGVLAGVARLEVLEQEGPLVRIAIICTPAPDPRPELYRRIKQTDWVLLDFHQDTQSLEAVFRELTKES
ncbi:MAG: ABC transporter ATP-binding protein [Desulfobacterales bacterium]|jgi:ABC-2 type transport system ATP-binding protein|nr:ABC transporter ATP-binding protein [Desulfobacterales bacterium]